MEEKGIYEAGEEGEEALWCIILSAGWRAEEVPASALLIEVAILAFWGKGYPPLLII